MIKPWELLITLGILAVVMAVMAFTLEPLEPVAPCETRTTLEARP